MRLIVFLICIVSLYGCSDRKETPDQHLKKTPVNSSKNQVESSTLAISNVLDLRKDGWNVFELSANTREVFVSHPEDGTKLYQWNMAEKKIVHTYFCPADSVRWDEAVVSPDGRLLVASTYPKDFRKTKVFFIDTQTQNIINTFDYKTLIRSIRFDNAGKLIWIETTYPGPDEFVRDRTGKKYTRFSPENFANPNRNRLWDIGSSKVGPPPGLFYKDPKGVTHKLTSNPQNQYYSFTSDGKHIGSATVDKRIRIWRVRDLQEIYNEEIGSYPVMLRYDTIGNQFLVLSGMDGNTYLRAIKMPKNKGEQMDEPGRSKQGRS